MGQCIHGGPTKQHTALRGISNTTIVITHHVHFSSDWHHQLVLFLPAVLISFYLFILIISYTSAMCTSLPLLLLASPTPYNLLLSNTSTLLPYYCYIDCWIHVVLYFTSTMYMYLSLTIHDRITFSKAHPWRIVFSLSQQLHRACIPSSRDENCKVFLFTLPCQLRLLLCRCCLGDHVAKISWVQIPQTATLFVTLFWNRLEIKTFSFLS